MEVERKQTFLLFCTLSRFSQVFVAETEGRRRAPGSLLVPCIAWITYETPLNDVHFSGEMTFDIETLHKRDLRGVPLPFRLIRLKSLGS